MIDLTEEAGIDKPLCVAAQVSTPKAPITSGFAASMTTVSSSAASTMAEDPRWLNALPGLPEELFAAAHAHELPKSGHTIVRVNYRQMGLGGDRGWGATPVAHPAYLLYANRSYHFEFSFWAKAGR